MSKMNGCNAEYQKVLVAQGTGRMVPGKFARNNLAAGGVNKMMADGGKASQGSVRATSTQKGGKAKY